MTSTLVIGIGNTLRSDDGAGIRAAELLRTRSPSVEVVTTQQLTPDFAETVSTYARVVILDASVAIDDLRVRHVQPGSNPSPPGSHISTPEDILALSLSLYGRAPRELLQVEIPAHSLEFSEGLSPSTELAMNQAVEIVERLLLRHDL